MGYLSVSDGKAEYGCGVATVSGCSYNHLDPKTEILSLMVGPKVAFFVFCDAQMANKKDTGMISFQKFVEEKGLGPIIETPGWVMNQAHGPRSIKIYVWRPDREGEGMKKFLEENKDNMPVYQKSMMRY